MTATLDVSSPRGAGRSGHLPTWTVPAAVLLTIAARLPFLGHAAGPDEAGFLLVGGQWTGHGASLYNGYWVDRPPLLISLFRLAASTGGLTSLRLMGVLAAALTVFGSAAVARRIGGPGAAGWAAVVAAGLSISPLLGGYEVNGELLAAPFVVAGMGAMVRSLQAASMGRAAWAAAAAGGLGTCALLVKQNFADVAVFAVVALVVAAVRRDVPRDRLARTAAAGVAGAVAALVLLAWWTVAHGTSLTGVYDAMYPFRVHAGHVIAAAGGSRARVRLPAMLAAALVSGLGLLVLVVVRDVWTRRRREAVEWALLATIAFAIVSVMLGGNYWRHYLIELIVPVSIMSGVLAARPSEGAPSRQARERMPARVLVGYAAVAALLSWSVALAVPQGSAGTTVGAAVATSARPGDTIVTAYGHADVTRASGLSSPYAYLWSLPVKVRDPGLEQLNTVLSGPDAPTYVVGWAHIRSWGLSTGATRSILASDYRPVATVCGHTIYLHDGVSRAPVEAAPCPTLSHRLAALKEYTP